MLQLLQQVKLPNAIKLVVKLSKFCSFRSTAQIITVIFFIKVVVIKCNYLFTFLENAKCHFDGICCFFKNVFILIIIILINYFINFIKITLLFLIITVQNLLDAPGIYVCTIADNINRTHCYVLSFNSFLIVSVLSSCSKGNSYVLLCKIHR